MVSSLRLPAPRSAASMRREWMTLTLMSRSPWNSSTGAVIAATLRSGEPSSMCGPLPIYSATLLAMV